MGLNKQALLHRVVESVSHHFPKTDLSLFWLRLGKQYDAIYDLYQRLYGDREDTERQLTTLIHALAELYVARDPDLKHLDVQREHEPGWIMSQHWVQTMLYVDRFSQNLKGFLKKIDYLEELGVNYVHLMPLLKMPSDQNDGGYAVSDYRTVDKKFGSMSDIRHIAKTFRQKNMLLELDLVLNHTSHEHEWAQKALAGDPAYQAMYYMYEDRTIPDQFEQTLPEVFPENAPGNFTWLPQIQRWVFTVFNTYQWDLNYTNPVVFTEMTKIMLNLANQGVDILRLDAVAFMWKKLGTNSQNLDEAHWLLQLFKCCTKVVAPGVVFKAEAIVQPLDIIKYLGGGQVDECEIAYNASLMVYLWDAIATQNKRILETALQNAPRIPQGTTWINYIRCHDDIGLGYADRDIQAAGYQPNLHKQFIVSYYVGEFQGSHALGQRFMFNPKTLDSRISGATASLLGLEKGLQQHDQLLIEQAIAKILLMHAAIMSFGGIPLVYYGDELASINDYTYLQDPTKADDNRWLNRPVIDWGRAAKRHDEGSVEAQVFQGIKRLIALRKSLPEFHNENDYQMIPNANPHVITYLREHQGEKTLVVLNVSAQHQTLQHAVLEACDFSSPCNELYHDQQIEFRFGRYELEPYAFLWLKPLS